MLAITGSISQAGALLVPRSFFPGALFALLLDLLCLPLNRHPNAIKLHDWRNGENCLLWHLLDECFDLIDPLVERPKPDVPFCLGTPALRHRTSTLPQTSAKKCLLFSINPPSLKFLE